jgi:uroporphyrinogen decarboxylase
MTDTTQAGAQALATPREAVLAALDHKESRLVPYDLGSTKITSICSQAYRDLAKALGINVEPIRITNVNCQLPRIDPCLLKAVGASCVGIEPNPPSRWRLRIYEEGDYRHYYDEWGVHLQMPLEDGHYFDRMEGPIKEPTVDALAAYEWPDPDDPARYRGLRQEALRLRDTGRALIGSCPLGTDITSRPLWNRSYVDGMIDLLDSPGFVDAMLDRCMEIALRSWDRFLAEVGDLVDIVFLADDLGAQDGPLFSPSVYRRFFKPRLAETVRFLRQRTPARVFLHSCGAIYPFIPDLIDMGVDILNPVQVSASGMGDTARLKREFGKDLTFWGAIDTQYLLPFGSPEEVRRDVLRRLKELSPGGGYVAAAVHNIQDGTPPQNIVAMVDAIREFGRM